MQEERMREMRATQTWALVFSFRRKIGARPLVPHFSVPEKWGTRGLAPIFLLSARRGRRCGYRRRSCRSRRRYFADSDHQILLRRVSSAATTWSMPRNDRRVVDLQAIQLGGEQLLECKLSAVRRRIGDGAYGTRVIRVRFEDDLFLRQVDHHHVLAMERALDGIDFDRPHAVLERPLVFHVLELDLLTGLSKRIRPRRRSAAATTATTAGCGSRRSGRSRSRGSAGRRHIRLQGAGIAEPFFNGGLVHLVGDERDFLRAIGQNGTQAANMIQVKMRRDHVRDRFVWNRFFGLSDRSRHPVLLGVKKNDAILRFDRQSAVAIGDHEHAIRDLAGPRWSNCCSATATSAATTGAGSASLNSTGSTRCRSASSTRSTRRTATTASVTATATTTGGRSTACGSSTAGRCTSATTTAATATTSGSTTTAATASTRSRRRRLRRCAVNLHIGDRRLTEEYAGAILGNLGWKLHGAEIPELAVVLFNEDIAKQVPVRRGVFDGRFDLLEHVGLTVDVSRDLIRNTGGRLLIGVKRDHRESLAAHILALRGSIRRRCRQLQEARR